MAINYEPPSPVAPYTSAAYGAAEEYDKMAPIVLQYRQAQLQAGLAGAQAYQSGINSTNQRTEAAGQQNTQLEALHQSQVFQGQQEQIRAAQAQSMQYQQQEQQAAEQRSQQEQQSRMLQQHYDLQFSQEQELQRQKLQSADTWVDQQVAAFMLTPEDGVNMKAGIRNLRTPLELQKMKSEAAQRQAQAQEQQALVEQKTQQQLKIAGLAAKTAQERTVPIYKTGIEDSIRGEMGEFDPANAGVFGQLSPDLAKQMYEAEVQKRLKGVPNGIESYIYTDAEGKTHIIKPDKSTADSTAQEIERAKQHWQAMDKKAITALDAEIKRATNPKLVNPDNLEYQRKEWENPAKQQEFVRNFMKFHVGAGSQEEYMAGVNAGVLNPPRVPGAKWGNQGGAVTPTATAEGQPTAEKQPAFQNQGEQKPFSQENLKNATKQQQEAVASLHDYHAMVSNSNLPPVEKEKYRGEVNWAIHVLERYGSVENAYQKDPAAAKQVEAVVAHMSELRKQQQEARAAAAQGGQTTPSNLTPFADPIGTLKRLGIESQRPKLGIPQKFFGY